MSFYSSNSSMILFVYWYKGISEINVSAIISKTKCKPVTINPCILHCGTKFGTYCDHDCGKHSIKFRRYCNHTYLNTLLTYGGFHISHLIDNIFEYALYGVNCVIILLSNTHYFYDIEEKNCYITLTPGHPIDIQLRFTRYYSDFSILEKALVISKNNNISFGNLSKPAVPRIVPKKKLFYLDKDESNFIMPGKQTVSSGIYFSQDASFEFKLWTFLTRSRIELFIKTRPENATSYLNLRRMAVDFIPQLTYQYSVQNYQYIVHKGIFHLLYVQHTLLLKSKANIINPNKLLYVSFDTYVKWPWTPNYRLKLYVWYSFPFYKLRYGKYISPSGDKRGNSHLSGIYPVQGTEPVTAVWMKDNYIRHSKFEELRSEECSILLNFSLCRKVKLNRSVYYREYYLITQTQYLGYRPKGYKLRSWEEAANICQLIGRNLPWFDSRDSLYELVSLFKLSSHFPTTEAIYIGLKYNTTKVSENCFFISVLHIDDMFTELFFYYIFCKIMSI